MIVVILLLMMGVKLAGEGHTVARLLARVPDGREPLIAKVPEAAARISQAAVRVLHGPQRGVVVGSAARAPSEPDHPVAGGVLEVGVATELLVGGATVERYLAVEILWRVVAVAVVRRDRIDHATHRVAAVQQSGRPLQHLDALQASGVDRDAVVARLAGDVAAADAVLHDQHAVAVESPNNRAAVSGPETALGDTRLPLENVTQVPSHVLGEVDRIQRAHRVERLERGCLAARRGDGDLLVDGREAQLES